MSTNPNGREKGELGITHSDMGLVTLSNGSNGSKDSLSSLSSPLSPSQQTPLTVSESRYLRELRAQSSIYSRFLFARQNGLSGFNSQYNGYRDLNSILGYDETIEIAQYRYAYERGGIAKRIVEIFPRATWGNGFDIADNTINLKRKTPYEKEVLRLYRKLNVHQKLLQATILAYIGHFSVILIGAPGDPETELPKKTGPNDIAYLYPLGEDKAKIVETVGQNNQSKEVIYDPRYGLPLYYEINLSGFSAESVSSRVSNGASSSFARKVHYSRVIHIVRSPLDSEIIGEPILRSVWNLLSDLKKIIGGLSEAALRRGWPGLHVNVDADARLGDPEKDSIREQVDSYLLGLGNGIFTRKTDIGEIATKGTIDIKSNAEAIMQQIAGTIAAPMRLLLGSEVGSLASSQDKYNFGDRVMELRASENDPIIRQFNDRMTEYGYLPQPRNGEYEILWPEEEELNEESKARTAKLMKEGKVLTDEEIRDRIYGLSPVVEEDKEKGGEKGEEEKEEDGEEIPEK